MEPDRIKRVFPQLVTQQHIVLLPAGGCSGVRGRGLCYCSSGKIRQRVKTIGGCLMTGSADNSLPARKSVRRISLRPHEARRRADTCSALTCRHTQQQQQQQQLTLSLCGRKNVQRMRAFAAGTGSQSRLCLTRRENVVHTRTRVKPKWFVFRCVSSERSCIWTRRKTTKANVSVAATYVLWSPAVSRHSPSKWW